MAVPVLSIQFEIQAYQDMGRLDKAAMLKGWLSKNNQEKFE